MKRIFPYILGIIYLVIAFASCTPEEFNAEFLPGEEVWVNFNFGHKSFDNVKITTKATLDIAQEARVLNMYVFVFTPDGNRIYSHYFDRSNRYDTEAAVTGADMNCWYVNTTEQGNTKGTVRIKAPQMENAVIYLVANLDADMLNISSERMATVTRIDELESLTVNLIQLSSSRNGYFPMVAKLSGAKINRTSIEAGTAYLERLDAKVTVKVNLANNDELKAFIPDKCIIRNLPGGSRVVNTAAADYEEAGYFDSEVSFDEQIRDAGGNITEATCSFYMLENRESKNRKKSISGYHDRDKRITDEDGSYVTSGELWLNAPENSTYIEIKGELHMQVNTSLTGMQELVGDVVYFVHLGNFASNINDYDVNRNTHYTYNITINGVDNIRVEVEDGIENESGATGHIYSAIESNFTFDAHYGQRVFSIDAETVGLDAVTFYVKTPFGREGTPELPGGGYDLSDLDYKWVSFLVNEVETSTGSYSMNNRVYPGDNNEMLIAQGSDERLMNVVELINLIKEEKVKFNDYKENGFVGANPSKFLNDGKGNYVLNLTSFVNEYYYEEHPTEARSIAWQEFVGKPNRLMHILCDTRTSKDGASSVTGSVVTLRQRSIQTPYSLTKSGLNSAFGCEVIDETRDDNLTFYEDDDIYEDVDFGNNSTNNGLYNTACLWNLFSNGTLKTGNARERWSTYINYSLPNRSDGKDNTFLREGMECMRYAAMLRNRDNNGNGYIDPEELRWYIAPLEQLYALYVGDLGINSEAQLYPISLASLDNSKVDGVWQWRNHIVCSNKTTITNSDQYVSEYWPDMLWAEEGVSISGYMREWEKPSPKSIRCVRNLGLPYATQSTIANVNDNVPEPMIKVTSTSNGVYRFDLSNINDYSVRILSSNELVPGDEYSENSRTFYGFETYGTTVSSSVSSYSNIKQMLERGDSPCPSGYRLPNVREAALMSLFCPSSWWGNSTIISGSYYSHGDYGTQYDQGATWYFRRNYVTISSTSFTLRCVKDWDPR